jgi:hypothetical protein
MVGACVRGSAGLPDRWRPSVFYQSITQGSLCLEVRGRSGSAVDRRACAAANFLSKGLLMGVS